jgi:hypothetical protein
MFDSSLLFPTNCPLIAGNGRHRGLWRALSCACLACLSNVATVREKGCSANGVGVCGPDWVPFTVDRQVPTIGKQGEKSFLILWVDHMLARTSEPVDVFAVAMGKYAKSIFGRAGIKQLVLTRFTKQTWVVKHVREQQQVSNNWLRSATRETFISRLENTNWPMPKKLEGTNLRFEDNEGPREFVEKAEQ